MRIVLFLLAATAAAASGPAPAQSGSLSSARGGSPAVATGSWTPGHNLGRHRDFRRGPDGDRGRHDRRRHGRFGRGGERLDLPSGGIASIEEFEAVDPHGNGFFAGGGGEVRLRGGRPYYDYDRSYPYEWASAAGGGEEWPVAEGYRVPQCGVEHGVRVCRGRR